MAKDPSFLFYSKDWLEGTAELTHQEKGVYIDLLAHQHQKGSLPADTKRLARIVGLSEVEFLAIWEGLKVKFSIQSDNRLVNRKLTEVMTERATKSHTNRITAKFATLIRSVSHLPRFKVETLKKSFKVTDFDHYPTEEATERLTEWFHVRLKSIEDGNANTNEDENTNRDSIGGMGEKKGDSALIPQMQAIWVSVFPTYTKDRELDYPALRQISDFIFKNAGIKNGYGNTDMEIKVLNTFQLIADQVNREQFWLNKPLTSIAKNIQEFYNKIKNPVNGTGTKKQSTGQKLDDDKLKQKLDAKRNEWQQARS